ncbi:hypothetical protein PMAC_001359 [Pneumocystis sp. 'macacae']|nr:hypothetical protein PMAC_001359 [Pneumocystis sp. 'macacae']
MDINNNIVINFIHYALPWLLLTLYITASVTSKKHIKEKQNISLLLQTISSFLILLTFVGDSILFLIYILIKQNWWIAQSIVKPTLGIGESSPLFEEDQIYDDDELSFLQGNMGLISSIRSHLWIPINQHAYRNLSVKAFEHIHTLSLDFHLSKKTGEIMSALDHGSLNFLNTVQNAIYTIGLLSIAFLSAYKVVKNQTSVGNFVSLLTYMTQLQGPLNYFGSLYRSLQSSLVDAERMLELFNEKPSVFDKPDAIDLKITHGEVIFDNVHFSYDNKKTALKALSFHAKAGTSIALVGNGSGKTTVLRCLFKFFNIDSGAIKIDGQNIHDVKLSSLRKNIGIVPQDTVLFNDTIMFNIRYAKPDASDEEVFEAARMAQIHNKIMTWPNKYDTRVGERGLRLSGGEKQRIAIARTILKNPKIILLDEATSALDTHTERQVQIALKKLAEGRTTICIAHRLSTIISCDLILCMKDGSIVESGTHEELLDQTKKMSENCLYYSMWQKQIHADKNPEKNDKRDKKH